METFCFFFGFLAETTALILVSFNFFLLGVTVQRALETGDVKAAKSKMKISQALRLIMLGVVAILGATLFCFNLWATLIPMLFPRISLIIRGILMKKKGGGGNE